MYRENLTRLGKALILGFVVLLSACSEASKAPVAVKEQPLAAVTIDSFPTDVDYSDYVVLKCRKAWPTMANFLVWEQPTAMATVPIKLLWFKDDVTFREANEQIHRRHLRFANGAEFLALMNDHPKEWENSGTMLISPHELCLAGCGGVSVFHARRLFEGSDVPLETEFFAHIYAPSTLITPDTAFVVVDESSAGDDTRSQ